MPLTRTARKYTHLALVAAVLGLSALGHASASPESEIEEQRAMFRAAHAAAERGDWSVVEDMSADQRASLARYPLWPDLRATFFRATLKQADREELENFLDEYGTLKPARDLRYRYARYLASSGYLAEYFDIYQQYYQGLENADLDCIALEAELEAGRDKRVVYRARELWLVGRSQSNKCDPVFEFLEAENLLGPHDYVKRFDLAVEEREFSLAKWLAKSIDQQHVAIADRWLQAQGDPEKFVRRHMAWTSDQHLRDQLAYAIERITYRDPDIAHELWQQLIAVHSFAEAQELVTDRHIALWTARDRLPDAYVRLIRLPAAAQNDEVLRWRARTSLRQENWQNLVRDVELMSAEERDSEEWQYWYHMAKRQIAPSSEADAALTKLAAERSYYGFLAADAMQLEYALDNIEFLADEALITQLEQRADVIRARELFMVGLDSRGRSEWDNIVRQLSGPEKVQAAKLASRWGWHSRAISTIASAGQYDDLALRYPLPYHSTFEQHAASASIPSQWAYGIARSESLFMRDVRSSAGAIGLMQLMPATGKEVAEMISLPYAGIDTLTNPQSNIRLGTSYLGQMARRYGGNRVLATAAYNAGPHRVDRWLPPDGKQDARIWIENIPFNETRKYVRRVLAAETIFHWRMTGEIRRLSTELGQVDSESLVASL